MRQIHDAVEQALSLRIDMRFRKTEDVLLAEPKVLSSLPDMALGHHVRFHAWPTALDHASPRVILDGLETGLQLAEAYDYELEHTSHSVNVYLQPLGKIGVLATADGTKRLEMLRLVELRMSDSHTAAEADAALQHISALEAVDARLASNG